MTAPALAVEDLEVRHGAVTAVRGLSFEVGHGEIVGLIGPNGAGKSSTLHAIMGAVRPAAGDVRVNGISVVGRRPEDVARRGRRARAGRAAHLRRADGRGESSARARRAAQAGRRGRGHETGLRPVSGRRGSAHAARQGRSPAVSSNSSRSRGPSSRTRRCCSWTSPRSGSLHAWSTWSSRHSPPSATAVSRSCSSSSVHNELSRSRIARMSCPRGSCA